MNNLLNSCGRASVAASSDIFIDPNLSGRIVTMSQRSRLFSLSPQRGEGRGEG